MTIRSRAYAPADSAAIENLFVSAFTRSAGAGEGALVGTLARQLMDNTDPRDRHGFVADDDGTIVGAIFFSRLGYQTDLDVFLLSPVAVSSERQGEGIGQALIRHGLAEMARLGAKFVTTYGDPAFYGKVGFDPISTAAIAPPWPLSQPRGWLGQSLGDTRIDAIPGPSACVAALDDPAYW